MAVDPDISVKVTDTVMFPFNLKVQEEIPLHGPPHPPSTEPEAGAAVSVTCDPSLTVALHAGAQLIAPPLPVTIPLPVPETVTVKVTARGLDLPSAPQPVVAAPRTKSMAHATH